MAATNAYHTRPLCSIIIPVLNQCRYTRQCLESIFRCADDIPFEVLLVDNGSDDQTPALLDEYEERYSEVRTIRFSENLGFSTANNQAAEIACGQYLVFLNNDTMVTPNWLRPLFEASQNESSSIVGSKLVYPVTNNINHAGYVYNHDLRLYYPIYHCFWSENPAVNQQREYQALLGAALFMAKDLFQKVGGFADYGLEDIDLCLKVREMGGQVLYCPRSKVYHYGSVTLKNTPSQLLPVQSTDEFNRRWPFEQRLSDDLMYFEQDGFEVEALSSDNIRLWRKDNPALETSSRAEDALREGDIILALQLTDQACTQDPQCKEILMLRSKILAASGDDAGFIQSIMKLIALDPLYYEGYIIAAERLIGLGESTLARQLLNTIGTDSPLPFDILEKINSLIKLSM